MTLTSDASHPGLRTFLIADVRGYTRFTAEHGDDAAAHLAATFAALARDAVEARGGRVVELRGDEVLAVFDAAAGSIRAALELQWTCAEEVATDPTLPLLVGIGIAAGEAVPVEEGFRGAALNLAARLCSTAAAGEVLVSEWVAGLASSTDGMSFEDRGTVELKGFPDPVPYLEVMPERVPSRLPPSETQGSAGGLAAELDAGLPLIGREHEMRWARGTWRQVQRGQGRVLVISGPSGIGKTRLGAEVAAHVEASGGQVRYAGAGGTAIADIVGSIEAARAATTPSLVILDDFDAAGAQAATALAQALEELQRRPVLVLALAQRPDALPTLAALVEVLDVRGDGHRELGPLDLEGIREICRIYAGDDVVEAPIESIARSSAGIPGQVHEVMSSWAREEATRRLEAAAEWLTTGRERRSAGLGFANNVIGLKLDRIYGLPEVGEESVCPYMGLASYGEQDARFFFGREALVGELAARSVGVGLLGVVGASGSGKSSVVAAGLRSSLAAGLLPGSAAWRQVSLKPGEHPMAELTAALGGLAPGSDDEDPIGWATDTLGPDERLVLYVDQFEEIFTTCTDQEEAATFVGALARAGVAPERAVVVVCLRGDFYAHTATYPALAEALSANHVIVGPMSPEELRRAIGLPARRAGLRVENALVDRLVEEVSDAPGGLPLLSTSLVELWGQRAGGWIRLEAHELTGGLNGAVARLAEQTYGELSDAQKAVAPAVFLRLVGPGEGVAVTRRRVPLDEFDTQTDVATAEVIRRFTQDRLLSADDRSVEVAHEALLREWPRLKGWLAEDTQGRELRGHLTGAARTWQDAGEEDSELYRGARLAATLDWSSTHDKQLNDLERSFLTVSRQAGEREVERQRRTNRRLRGLLVGVALFLVVALVAGSLALVQRSRAADARTTAQAEALQADAERIGAQARIEPNLDRAMLMAVAGVKLADTPQTRASLLATLERSPAATHFIRPSKTMASIALSPDGNLLAIADEGGIVRFWSVDSWTLSGDPVTLGPGINPRAMVFSPDGTSLIVGVGSRLEVIDVATRTTRTIASWPTTPTTWEVVTVASSPDGSRIAVGLAGHPGYPDLTTVLGKVFLVDASSGRTIWSAFPYRTAQRQIWLQFLPGHPGELVTSATDETTYLWRSGRIVRRYPVGGPFALAPDGRLAAIAQNKFVGSVNPEAGMALLNLRTKARRSLQGDLNATIQAMVFTPDGRSIIGGSAAPADDTIHLWDIRTGRITETFAGQSGWALALALSRKDQTLFSGGNDGSVIAWDVAGTQRLGRTFTWAPLESGCGRTPCAVINGQGTLMAASRVTDGSTYLVDLKTFQSRHVPVRDGFGSEALAFFPDGRTLATGNYRPTEDGRFVFWVTILDTQTKRALRTIRLSEFPEYVAVSPGGALLATLNVNPDDLSCTLQLWDTTTWKVVKTYEVGEQGNWDNVAFSPDGRELAVSTTRVEVFDVGLGRRLFSPSVANSIVIAFSHDSQQLAVGTDSGEVAMLDARTGVPSGSPIHASGGVYGIVFQPNGPLVSLSTLDLTASLWDMSSRQRIGTFPTDLTGPGAIFTPDGNDVVVVYEGHAAEWPLDLLPGRGSLARSLGGTSHRMNGSSCCPVDPTNRSARERRREPPHR